MVVTENVINFRNTSCNSAVPADFMVLYRAADSNVLPGPGYIGILFVSIWYWCTDQVGKAADILILEKYQT